MNELKVFNSSEFGKIRTIEKELKGTYLGVIYAAEYGDKLKIGCSSRPYTRIMVLKRNAEKYGDVVFGRVCISIPHTNYREVESFLQSRFSSLRKAGTELFTLKFDDFVCAFQSERIDFKDETKKFEARAQSFLNGMKRFVLGGNMTSISVIKGIECYEKDGTAYLKLETVARGLGFTRIAASGNEVVRWETIRKYLSELGVPTSWHGDAQQIGKDGLPDFIPENIFYRLAMKAKNEAAEKFQAKVADEVLPSIRRHGAYMTPETLEAAILNPDTMIKLCTALKEEQDKRKALEVVNSALTVDNAIMAPKADYFDELVDRNLLTNFRETAKQLNVPPKKFVSFLLERKYIYRDKRGKLLPYEEKNNGLFEVKECYNDKTQWSGTQTLVTPKGRETFRLLLIGAA